MKKKFFGLTMALVLAGSLTGCGGRGAAKEAISTEGGDTGNCKLTIWESADGPDEFIKKAGEEFTKANPNIQSQMAKLILRVPLYSWKWRGHEYWWKSIFG